MNKMLLNPRIYCIKVYNGVSHLYRIVHFQVYCVASIYETVFLVRLFVSAETTDSFPS